MLTEGGPFFTFSLPGGAARPLAPTSVTPLRGSDFNNILVGKSHYGFTRLL